MGTASDIYYQLNKNITYNEITQVFLKQRLFLLSLEVINPIFIQTFMWWIGILIPKSITEKDTL